MKRYTGLCRLGNSILTTIRYQDAGSGRTLLQWVLSSYWCTTMPSLNVAKVCRQFLENDRINMIDWSSCSPDLNSVHI